LLVLDLIILLRWVYKRIFVADGNFKADHVRQANVAGDVWLSEGGGIMAKTDEYHVFLRSAIERLTVCSHLISSAGAVGQLPMADGTLRIANLSSLCRKRHVKTLSEPLQTLYWHLRHAMSPA